MIDRNALERPLFRYGEFLCWATIIVILVGIAIRLTIGTFLTCPDDVNSWAVVIANYEAGGGLYDIAGYNYAPPWGYILAFASTIWESLGMGFMGAQVVGALPAGLYADWLADDIVPGVGFSLCVKCIFILSDIVAGYLVYWIVMNVTNNRSKAILGFSLWFLCSFVITSGSVQGMFDTVSATVTLLCIAMVLRNHYFIAGMMLGTATLLKLFPGFLIFVLAAYVLARHREDGTSTRRLMEAASGAVVSVFILLLPQILAGDLSSAFAFLTERSGNMGTSIDGIVGIATIVAYVAILIASAVIGLLMYNSQDDDLEGMLLKLVTLNVAVMFLYPSTAQYLTLLAPFLIMMAVCYERRFKTPFIVLSIGVPIFALSRTVINLMSYISFEDPAHMDALMSAIKWTQEPLISWITPNNLLSGLGGCLSYLGVVLVVLTFLKFIRTPKDESIPWHPFNRTWE